MRILTLSEHGSALALRIDDKLLIQLNSNQLFEG